MRLNRVVRFLLLSVAVLVAGKASAQSVDTFIRGTIDIPTGIAFDKVHNLYVTNDGDGSVQVIAPDGVQSVLADATE